MRQIHFNHIRSAFVMIFVVVLIIGTLAGCSSNNSSNSQTQNVSSASTSNEINAVASSTSGSKTPLNNTSLVGLWELSGCEIDEAALTATIIDEKERATSRWNIQDSIEMFIISGSYLEFNEDGTYQSFTGKLDSNSGTYKITKSADGTFIINDDGTATLSSNGTESTVNMLNDNSVIYVKRLGDDSVYSTIYNKVIGQTSSTIADKPMPEGIIYSSRANVCQESAQDAVVVASVDEKSTQDQSDDTITLEIDSTKLNNEWEPNKPIIIVESCPGYPTGLAVQVDELLIDNNGIWHISGSRPNLSNVILSMNIHS